MSAYLVTKTHIDVLVFFHSTVMRCSCGDAGDHDFGRMLWRENMRSMAARYDESIDEETLKAYRYSIPSRALRMGMVDFIKAANCYAYQACEHDGWEGSEAKKFIDALLSEAISRLPGYKDAAWSIPDEPSTVRALF